MQRETPLSMSGVFMVYAVLWWCLVKSDMRLFSAIYAYFKVVGLSTKHFSLQKNE